jgi:hypothetical protein
MCKTKAGRCAKQKQEDKVKPKQTKRNETRKQCKTESRQSKTKAGRSAKRNQEIVRKKQKR